MIKKELGRIASIEFGRGGYNDAMIGLTVQFSGKGWGVGWFDGTWNLSIKPGEHSQWTESERDAHFARLTRYIDGLLETAKRERLSQLRGLPVEVEFESNVIKSWRLLDEVL